MSPEYQQSSLINQPYYQTSKQQNNPSKNPPQSKLHYIPYIIPVTYQLTNYNTIAHYNCNIPTIRPHTILTMTQLLKARLVKVQMRVRGHSAAFSPSRLSPREPASAAGFNARGGPKINRPLAVDAAATGRTVYLDGREPT